MAKLSKETLNVMLTDDLCLKVISEIGEEPIVFLTFVEGFSQVALYYSDSINYPQEWIEYNSKCIVVISRESNEVPYIHNVVDVETLKPVYLSKKQIEENYGLKLEDDITDNPAILEEMAASQQLGEDNSKGMRK